MRKNRIGIANEKGVALSGGQLQVSRNGRSPKVYSIVVTNYLDTNRLTVNRRELLAHDDGNSYILW